MDNVADRETKPAEKNSQSISLRVGVENSWILWWSLPEEFISLISFSAQV
jgi:hypothetical protein